MKVNLLRQVGYCLIWADLFLVFLAGHAMLVDPAASGAQYLREYFFVGFVLVEWVRGWGGFFDLFLGYFAALPAAIFFLIRFTGSTLIGVLLVRWSRAQTQSG
ncbi:MAG: hypothetical protein HOA39_00980 [Gammaproteobacteria bacterium]|jgi:hypothetical protein|nr:hypothetical protein [Gammaproteobacteria bacterium]